MGAITRWLEEKMRQARYDLRGPGRYSGEIPGLVQVEAENLEEARVRLREALEEKLAEMLRMGLPVEGFSEVDSRLGRFRGLVLRLWELMQEGPAKDAEPKPSIEKVEGSPSEPGPEGGASGGQDSFLEAWLGKRGVEVLRRPSPEGEEREKVLARLALFLGERFSSLGEAFLVVLGMDKAQAKELSALHGTSEATVLEAFLESLENA
ncbi:MAG: type II toxin-antitoxin system HicB family antitoxin [Thermaceae bacterium]